MLRCMAIFDDKTAERRLEQVRAGMHVVDAAGEDVGRVDFVQMGDPQADTTAGNEAKQAGAFDLVARALGGEREPEVPEPLRSRLVRSGYLKLDGANLLDADRYVPAEYVSSVAQDRVQLTVRREALAQEK
jgi:hypothetical protein